MTVVADNSPHPRQSSIRHLLIDGLDVIIHVVHWHVLCLSIVVNHSSAQEVILHYAA